jgi:hypothetical protein
VFLPKIEFFVTMMSGLPARIPRNPNPLRSPWQNLRLERRRRTAAGGPRRTDGGLAACRRSISPSEAWRTMEKGHGGRLGRRRRTAAGVPRDARAVALPRITARFLPQRPRARWKGAVTLGSAGSTGWLQRATP